MLCLLPNYNSTLQYLGKETLYRYSHALGLAEFIQTRNILKVDNPPTYYQGLATFMSQ